MAIESRSTLQTTAAIMHAWSNSLQGMQLDNVATLSRDGEDLILQLSDGRQICLDGAFGARNSLAELLPRHLADLLSQIGQMSDGDSVLVAQAGGGVTLAASVPSEEALVVGRVADANGEVKVQRNNVELNLKSGDALLSGDVIVTSQNSQLRLNLLSDQSTVKGSGVVGENTKVTLSRQTSDASAAFVDLPVKATN